MSRPRFLTLTLLLSALLVGCGSSSAAWRAVAKQIMTATKEMADLLATVKDKPTAQAAAPKLLALLERVEKLSERLDDLDAESEDMGADPEIVNEVGPWIAEQTRLMEEQRRISQIPEAREGLGEAWQRLTGGAYE